jgi:protein-S-isoprenylcysteine O-methyltransferase Ste14
MAEGESLSQKYFRYRGWIPLPLYLALLAPWPHPIREPRWKLWWAIGLGVVAVGAWFRLWAIRHIGKSARTRTEKTRPLIISGPYAIMRNPLYVANIIIAGGFALCACLPYYAPVLVLLLFLHYHIVAKCEEKGLHTRVGWEYEAYRGKVPRWIPRQLGPAFAYPAPNTVKETLFRERSGIMGVLAIIAVLAAATWFYLLR